jgi:hypothetical protein
MSGMLRGLHFSLLELSFLHHTTHTRDSLCYIVKQWSGCSYRGAEEDRISGLHEIDRNPRNATQQNYLTIRDLVARMSPQASTERDVSWPFVLGLKRQDLAKLEPLFMD